MRGRRPQKRKFQHKGGRGGPPNKRRRNNDYKGKPYVNFGDEKTKERILDMLKSLNECLTEHKYDLMKRDPMQSSDIGITEFASKIGTDISESKTDETKSDDSMFAPINGVIKHRYHDFIVYEINESKQAASLTIEDKPATTTTTTAAAEESKKEAKDADNDDDNDAENEKSKAAFATLSEFVKNESKVDSFKEYLSGIKEDKKSEFNFESIVDKSERTAIHKALNHWEYLEHSTKENNIINVRYSVNWKRKKERRWPSHRPAYLKFVLMKSGMDTMNCLNHISKKCGLKVATKIFGMSGTKDKRAVSAQWITAYHLTPETLQRAAGALKGVLVGDFEFVASELHLGELWGNRFVVTIRNIECGDVSREQIQTMVQSRAKRLSDIGFINYFGTQRFGTSVVGTHEIGRALLGGQCKLAVALACGQRSNERNDIAEARARFWKSGDLSNDWHPTLMNEKKIFMRLLDDPKPNYGSAFDLLQRHQRLMYIHAYQSLIFNKSVSYRLSKYGFKPIIGDCVQTKDGSISFIDESNINDFDITDIVLPLVSAEATYPKNDVSDYINTLIKNDNLSMDNLTKNKSFLLGICHRNIVVKPVDFEVELKDFDSVNSNDCLVDNPMAAKNKADSEASAKAKAQAQEELSTTSGAPPAEVASKVENEKKLACVASFSLPKSSYATICLAELLLRH